MRPPASSVALLMLAAVTAPAAGAPQAGVFESLHWPSGGGFGGGPGPFTGTAIARLSGDGIPDVAVVNDGDLDLFDQVDTFGVLSTITTTGTVNDIAALTIEGTAPTIDRDRLVVAASDGLWLGTEGASGITFTAIDTSSNWQDLDRVLVVDLDDDGDDDLLVLRADHRTVDAKIQRAAGTFMDTARFSWTATSDVKDLLVGEFDSLPAEPELVVNDQAGLKILSGGGATLASYASARSQLDRIALVKRDESSSVNDAIAWVSAATSAANDPQRYLFMVTLSAATPCFLTTQSLESAGSGRFDDDAMTDLVFAQYGETNLIVLYQQETGTPFDLSEANTDEVDLYGISSFDAARISVGDYDLDGIDDIVLPLASTAVLGLMPGPFKIVQDPGSTVNDFVPSLLSGTFAPQDFENQVFHVVAQLVGATAYAADPNADWRLQCIVQKREASSGDFSLVHYCREDLSNVMFGFDKVVLNLPINPAADQWYVLMRLVRMDGEDVITAKPQIVGLYSSNINYFDPLPTGLPDDLESLMDANWTEFAEVHQTTGTTTRIGGFIRIRRMPTTAPTPPPAPPSGVDCN